MSFPFHGIRIMKKLGLILASLTLCTLVHASGFTLQSTDFKDQAPMGSKQEFNSFGCTGQNVSPQLSWQNAPIGTKSIAITVYDPDAPTGSGWWHWLVVNIPASVNQLASGQVPVGSLQTRTDYGGNVYGGACPPAGDKPHRYIHTVWALDVEQLPVDANASGALVGFMLNQHALGKARLTTFFSR